MKISLDHLPEPKQAQLRAITALFCADAPMDMLILFGSHARGDYHAALLVFTGYKQRTHDIELLGSLAGAQHPLLVEVFPKTAPEDARHFELLKKAYIDSRYSMSYRITTEELRILQGRVLHLGERVRTACLEMLASFAGAAAVRGDLPVPPQLQEPVLTNLPPPPEAPEEFGQWAQSLVELAEQKGFVAGEQKGEAKGEAKALLLVLRARGIPVLPELEQRILGCADPGVLLTWLQRAATASTAGEVVEDERAVAS